MSDRSIATVKEDLYPSLHDVRYEATLKYNISHELYRPLTDPAYVGEPSPEIDADLAVDVFVTPDEQERLGGGLFLDKDTGLHLAEVTVFHDLHCMVTMLPSTPVITLDSTIDFTQNFIRKSFYPDYYVEMTSHRTWRAHLEHCIDAVRLSLMCAGDMTLIPVKWSENRNWIMPIFETVHTCRDFDALRAWALERDAVDGETYRANAAKLRGKAGITSW
ncbi:hypothetical protein F5Y15DRAFT_425905 [Xylariaceae sp. FL0016]|nr:hypothetical protein F5Y15DRAFT_425905 [Xylariaceae sp. FL0016]